MYSKNILDRVLSFLFCLQLKSEEMESSMNSCDVERLTPLHYAAMFDHTDLVEYLVSQVVSKYNYLVIYFSFTATT